MPFKSDKQRRYLYAEKPDVARKYAADTSKNSAYAKAIRDGNQSTSKKTKKSSTGGGTLGSGSAASSSG